MPDNDPKHEDTQNNEVGEGNFMSFIDYSVSWYDGYTFGCNEEQDSLIQEIKALQNDNKKLKITVEHLIKEL